MRICRFATVLALVAPAQVRAQLDTAFSVPVEVKSGGVTLRATLFVAAGSGPHATLVSLKGFPGSNSTALSRFLQSKGLNSIAMNFRGQQDSDGTYDVGGTPADASALISFLRSDSARRAYRIDPRRIAISGTSAGSFGALGAGASDESIRCIALIVPFNWTVTLMAMRDNPLLRTALMNQVQSITSRQPASIRLDTGFTTRTFANAEAYDLRRVAPKLGGRHVYMIGAQYDSTARLATHFIPVRDSLRRAKAVVRDTVLEDTHNLTNTGDRVFDMIEAWLRECVR